MIHWKYVFRFYRWRTSHRKQQLWSHQGTGEPQLIYHWFRTSGIGRSAELTFPITNAINHIIIQFINLECGKSQTAGIQVSNPNEQFTIANTERATPCSGREGDKRVLVRGREGGGGDLFKLLNKLCQLLTKSSTVILHVPVSILAQVLPAHNEAQFTGV